MAGQKSERRVSACEDLDLCITTVYRKSRHLELLTSYLLLYHISTYSTHMHSLK